MGMGVNRIETISINVAYNECNIYLTDESSVYEIAVNWYSY